MEDITQFTNAKEYATFRGFVLKVKDSSYTVHHGSIIEHGPAENLLSPVPERQQKLSGRCSATKLILMLKK